MPTEQSVTQWIDLLKSQDEDAAQVLYQRYIHRLVGLARKKLGDVPRRVEDEDDVAHAALNSFFLGAHQGQFPRLNDRHDLWQVLVMLTERKAIDQKRRRFSQKHKAEVGESALGRCGEETPNLAGIQEVIGREPSPGFAAEVSEELRARLEQLADPQFRQIAVWKMEGWTNDEIAQRLGCVTRTVERRLEFIRRIWQAE